MLSRLVSGRKQRSSSEVMVADDESSFDDHAESGQRLSHPFARMERCDVHRQRRPSCGDRSRMRRAEDPKRCIGRCSD